MKPLNCILGLPSTECGRSSIPYDSKFGNARLVSSGVDLVFCDLPHVPPGAMGRFLLTQMASVAELEAGLISERTKAALAAARARGVKLGNPNGARALRGKQVGNKQAVAAVRANAEQRAGNWR